MSSDDIAQRKPSDPQTGGDRPSTDMVDQRARAVALGLEFTKRCFEASTLDDLYYLITNDIRVLLPFDRSVLVTHLGGSSRFVAAGNQPSLDSKSRFYQHVDRLAASLTALDKAVLLSPKSSISSQDVPEVAREALQSHLEFAGSAYVLCIPLIHNRVRVAHLILEFLDETAPDQTGILSVLNIAPFLGAALSEKWLASKKPAVFELLDPETAAAARKDRRNRVLKIAFVVAVCLICLFFVVPFPFDVGGEAEIIPTDRHVAFCKIDGLIERVNVAEGSTVQKGQVLATLDPRELDYKVKVAEKQYEIHTSEMMLLRASAGEDPSKLAESALVELKRRAAWEELQFLKWQQQFLEIKSPVAGIILTKDIESLAGKKLRAGEPFCEIAVPGQLSVEVFVPEDRAAYVKKGQDLTFYFAGNPWKAYYLKVQEVSPMAELITRLGNVYRIRALFPDAPASTMVGMKGIARIHVMRSSLWFIVTNRLLSRWQRWSLYW